MATQNHPSDRFRSATEFPKSIERLEQAEANKLYVEMRDCLIFTNRSRSQLLRRNEEHKQTTLQLKSDVARMQGLINQLTLEKTQITESNRQIVSELQQEMSTMASHLDELSDAFSVVANFDDPQQSGMGLLAAPGRFYRFLRAVRAIVLWWRKDDPALDAMPSETTPSQPSFPNDSTFDDRHENPQMHSDQASQGRSLLDR
jgi:TolA-binding protein